ncbi:hypothetical protein HID58_024910 [Brassica napus]|uniref:KNOX1 domain-containing protein n=1 Tax=Brassica napus TaxID=3708 RepID=A0ABQ8CJN3_BRANA|nr:hypothetical protein HID58_024910 [Brassica napus]
MVYKYPYNTLSHSTFTNFHLLPPQEDLPLRHFSDQFHQHPQPHFSETQSLLTASFLNLPPTAATADSDFAPPHRGGDRSAAAATNRRWLSFDSTEIQNTGEGRPEVIDGVNDGGGEDWKSASCKAAIVRHPMFEQLLVAHVACLRVAIPVDQIPRIDAQLSELHTVTAKYSTLGVVMDNKELDHFVSVVFSG